VHHALLACRSQSVSRRSASIAELDAGENATLQERVMAIEEIVGMCNAEAREICQDLKLLPQLCELLDLPLDAVKLPEQS
jgi:hypothetical protein